MGLVTIKKAKPISLLKRLRTKLSDYALHVGINVFAASWLVPKRIRFLIYRIYGIDTKTVNIMPGCVIGSNKLHIGKNTLINFKCFISNHAPVHIGNDCAIAPEVMFTTSTHEIGGRNRRCGEHYSLPIKVGNGVWIGTRAVILPGVKIGDGCVIAAGAVVNKDCEPNGLYAGVPAKRIKELD